MGSGPWSLLTRYGLAAVLTALAILASLLLAPHWNPRHLLLPFYPAVMLSAWFGGFGPGLLTTLLSALAMDYFWLPPTFAFGMREPGDLIGFVLFLGVGLLISVLDARLLRAQRHAEAAAAELRREVDERRKAEEAAAKLAKLAEELESSMERYRHHFKRHLAGVFRAQRDGRIVECSDAFARLLGAGSSAEVLVAQRERALPRSGGVAGAGGRSRPGPGDLEPRAHVAEARPHASELARQRPRSGR